MAYRCFINIKYYGRILLLIATPQMRDMIDHRASAPCGDFSGRICGQSQIASRQEGTIIRGIPEAKAQFMWRGVGATGISSIHGG